jgi:SAM-dependent methyltransferase
VTQNIYDDDTFFAAYSQLPRSVEGLDGAPEWPSPQALLPALRGRRVADLGCGFGWFCRWAVQQGAAAVLGIDVSDKMLARARTMTADAAIAYRQQDLERLDLPEGTFDLIYSSLALHYIADLDRLLSVVARALAPGGALVFSIEHPIQTAPTKPGWSVDLQGGKAWPVNHYFDEGERRTDWLTEGVIKQHRTLARYLNTLIGLGLALRHVEEWSPSAAQAAAHQEWTGERERPFFLLVAAGKPGS